MPPWKYLILSVLLQRIGLILTGYIAVEWFSSIELPWTEQLLDLWNRWDAYHYLKIAELGYLAEEAEILLLVFFPVYPLVVRLIEVVVPNFIVAGLLVSAVAQIIAGAFYGSLSGKIGMKLQQKGLSFIFIFSPQVIFLPRLIPNPCF